MWGLTQTNKRCLKNGPGSIRKGGGAGSTELQRMALMNMGRTRKKCGKN